MSREVVGVVVAVLIVTLLALTWLPHGGQKPAPSSQVPEYGGAPGAPSRGEPMMAKEIPPMMMAGAGEGQGGDITLASLTMSQPERYLIKNATLTLEVKETLKALQQLQAQIKENRGYLADLRQSALTQPLVPPESFSTSEVASNAVRSLVAFAQGIWSVLIWLAVWAVVWLPLTAIGWLAYRRIRRV